MILTHKTVQAAQDKAPQEVQPVPVEPSILSKGITAPFYHLEAVKVEKISYNGKGTIVDGEKYGSMHGNSYRHLQEKLLPYWRRLFLKYV